jgi:hypothetical protein
MGVKEKKVTRKLFEERCIKYVKCAQIDGVKVKESEPSREILYKIFIEWAGNQR